MANIQCKSPVCVLVAAFAFVEDGGAFVGAAQLLGVVADLGPAALLARLVDLAGHLHVAVGDGLHLGPLRAEGRGEGRGLGLRDDGFGGRVSARSTTHGTRQDGIVLAGAAVEQVAAVVAEDERADGRHGGALCAGCEMRNAKCTRKAAGASSAAGQCGRRSDAPELSPPPCSHPPSHRRTAGIALASATGASLAQSNLCCRHHVLLSAALAIAATPSSPARRAFLLHAFLLHAFLLHAFLLHASPLLSSPLHQCSPLHRPTMSDYANGNWHNLNGGGLPYRRPPKVDEALPLSPFTSIIPFSPGPYLAFTCSLTCRTRSARLTAGRHHPIPDGRAPHAALDPHLRPAHRGEEGGGHLEQRDQGPVYGTALAGYPCRASSFAAARQATGVVYQPSSTISE